MPSTSWTVIRRRLGPLVGPYGTFTATGGSTSTAICAAAFASTELPTSALAYAWLFSPASVYPQQRRIQATGLTPGSGTITLEGTLGTAIAANSVFEISARLPVLRSAVEPFSLGLIPGLLDCTNNALRHLLITDDTLSVSLVSGQQDYDLTSWPWLARSYRLLDVRALNATGSAYESVEKIHPWELRETPGGASLHFRAPFTFTSGSPVIKLVTRRPADTTIKLSGATSYSASTVGLVNEGDETAADVNDVLAGALAFCHQALRDTRVGAEKKQYDVLYQRQVLEFRKRPGYDHENDMDPNVADVPPSGEATLRTGAA